MEKDEARLLDKKINEILSSKKLIVTSRGPLWFTNPSLESKVVATNIYETTLEDNINRGILNSADLLKDYINLGLWDDVKEKNLKALPDMIDEVEQRITRERNRTKKKKLEGWLINLNSSWSQLIESRNTRLSNSAEFLAHDAASLYLVWSSVRTLNNKRLWKTVNKLQNETDTLFVGELIEHYVISMSDFKEKDIREIARSTAWRIRWHSFSNSCNELFGVSSKNLSNDQFFLLYWSQVYDSVYESMDRPPEDVIINDEALDKWLLEQSEKRKREIGQRYHGKGTSKGNSKIDNANEVFKVVDGEFTDDGEWKQYNDDEKWDKINKIRDLNSPVVRKIKRIEEKKLSEQPGVFIQEHELRKNKNHRETMGGNVTIKTSKPKGAR